MLLTLLSAVLFYLSFPNKISILGFWPCIWFFAGPLLLALHGKSLKHRLGYGLLWGLCAYGLMAQGIIRISPAAFVAFVLAMGIQALIFTGFFRTIKHPVVNAFYLSSIWCVSEVVRNFVMGDFSFYISHAQAFCPLMLRLYGNVGCLGMSGIIFLVNALIYSAIIYKRHRIRYALAAIFVFAGVLSCGFLRRAPIEPPGHFLRVAIIQGNISPLAKMDQNLFDHNAAIHLDLTRRSARSFPDVVIWPETAFPDDLLQSNEWRPLIFAQARRMNASMLMGIAPIMDNKEYNSALLINARGQVAGLYHKQALVPFAETMPLEALGVHWGHGYHITEGKKSGLLSLKDGKIPFGVMICSESAHPAMVRQLRREGAQFLVELSNDGWFMDKASYMLHAQAAVMRAVENHLWVIRAANTGFSFAVDPQGVIHTDRNLKLGHEGFGIFDIII